MNMKGLFPRCGSARSFGVAWIALSLSIGVHVADEALNGFLSVYNPAATSIRDAAPFLPFPTFTFGAWIGGLIAGVLLLLLLSPFAFRQAKWTHYAAYFLGVVMIINGLIHAAGSLYYRYAVPGVYSTPLLLACAAYLLVCINATGEGRPEHTAA